MRNAAFLTAPAAPPPPSRRAAGKARVRRELISAAGKLFASRGVAATTMDDVARLAQVSRATAFNYFPSKTLLLEALVREMESSFLERIELEFEKPATAAQRIAALFRWTAAAIEETPRLFRVLIGASETTFGQRLSGVRTERMHRALVRVLEAGRQAGDVRRDVRIAVLAEIVGGTYVGILHAWRVSARYPLRRRLDEAARALGQFISTPAR